MTASLSIQDLWKNTFKGQMLPQWWRWWSTWILISWRETRSPSYFPIASLLQDAHMGSTWLPGSSHKMASLERLLSAGTTLRLQCAHLRCICTSKVELLGLQGSGEGGLGQHAAQGLGGHNTQLRVRAHHSCATAEKNSRLCCLCPLNPIDSLTHAPDSASKYHTAGIHCLSWQLSVLA